MSKTIRFKENSLIAIKEKLNEIMAGNDVVVSPNDIVTLWHGTDIPGIVGILKSGTICAREGVQHGETYGMNWFSLKKVDNFNKGIVFSIEVPSSDFKTKFKMMNSSEAITRDDRLDISQYNLKIEMFCTFGREQLNRYYDLIVEKGEHYPIETIRDEVFYKWCEKSGNEDVYMSTSDYDLGLILSNILGEDKVRAEGFLEENTKLNEAAPEVDEYTICGEEKDGDVVAGGNYFHVEESIDFDNNGMSINDDKILGKYNLKDLILSKTGNYVTLNKIIANELGKGNGSRFMEELTRMADKNGWILALTPDTSFGGSSVGRLKKFYKRFGFVPNKGRSTDFNTRESMIRRPLGENKEYKNILTESQESKSIAAAKKLAMQRLGYNEQEADEFVRIKLRNDIPSLRTPQGGKFILGVARMFCDGELRSANDMGNLNSTLKLVASDAHINEYDRNLNGLSAQELVQRFAKAMSDNLEAEKAEINQMVFDTPSDYEIVRIDSFEQARQYGDYVSWCVTHDEGMFDSYTSNGINQFYFCLKNGFENVEPEISDGCPLDKYGLSMIAVSVNENGMLNTCTCRWNHDNGGDDSIMDAKQVSQVIGMNFFEVFKPNNKWKELVNSAFERLANGEDIYDVFNIIKECKNGVTIIELEDKYNLIKEPGMQLISPTWFDWITSFDKDFDDFFIVDKNEKNNLINLEGQLIINQWVDSISNHLYNGFIKAELNGKYNLITAEGKFVSDQWLDYIGAFSLGFASVKLNGKWNFIDDNGELLSNQWFESVGGFNEKDEFACVRLNGKENLIDTNGQFVLNHWFISVNRDNLGFYKVMDKPMGKIAYNFINAESQLLSDIWFDEIKTSFIDGFASVELDGKWNLINTEGQLVSNQWFDYVECFYRDVCRVMLNNKVNYINTEGQPISEQWFDKMGQFYDWWVTIVQLNGKYNLIDTKGTLISNQWFDEISTKNLRDRIVRVELNGKFNYLTYGGHLLSDMWFDWASDFNYGFASARLNGKNISFNLDDIIDANGNLTLRESNNKNKKILVSENQLKVVKENIESEVESSEIDLSSFKKRDTLPPGIWKDEETLNSKVRLKLLDIADDFWEFVNLTWVEPKGIIITGSICNFNWSKFSDIDLHLIVDFNEIDEKTEFVKQYLDSKKNEWNTEHEGLKIMGFPVELYVQNISDNVEAGGIYDLEENAWIRRPNPHTIKSIGLNKFNIKDKAAEIMTIIDDMYDKLSNTTDGHEIEEIGDDAHYLWDKVKDMRKKSLSKNGESGSGNIVYKVLRRTGYLDKLFKLFSRVYDRSNSISESMKKYLTVLKEEVAIDGSSENNPYEKRWKAEREALKSFVANYGKLMQSKEDNKGGKLYKVYFDETMSNLIGYNYCICVQWNEQEMKPGSTVYIRALDKFTPFIRRNLQFDTRGRDNMRGTYDDNIFVRESVDELNLYHSSYSNFDKFNHRKYLSSGAGSQTFGWGTYLTDSFPIAESYAGKFIWQKFNEFIVSAEPEDYIGDASQYNDEIVKEACRLYRSIVRTRIVFTYGIERKYSRNFFDCEFEVTGDPAEEYDNMMKKYEEFKQFLKAGLEKQAVKVTPPSDEQMRNAFSVMNSGGDMLDTPRDEYIATTTRRNSVNSLVKLIINNIWDAADNHVKKESYIYEVEIPDDNGYNYLDYSNPVSPDTAKLISSGVMKLYRRFGNKINTNRLDNAVEECLNGRMKGKYLYEELTSAFGGSEKAVSLFLNQCGIVGIKYRAGTIYGLPDGADESSLNYVIFDANNVRITSKNLFTDNF